MSEDAASARPASGGFHEQTSRDSQAPYLDGGESSELWMLGLSSRMDGKADACERGPLDDEPDCAEPEACDCGGLSDACAEF